MSTTWNKGSQWHRWDPHIHAPGTLFNDQFEGDWEGYLSAIESATPSVKALGITDYCTLNSYREFLKYWKAGRASNVTFVFPNIEFRLTIQTASQKGVNLHLLFSPEDVDHLDQIERVLSSFTFEFRGQQFRCLPADLIRLGKSFNPSQTDDLGALRDGARQFKLSVDALRQARKNNKWMRENCIIAVEAGQRDGTSGLQSDHAFMALREELEALAGIIFSAKPSDRKYWLGMNPKYDQQFIEKKYGQTKPCLHGSDAHELSQVLRPDEDRYCWIRADVSFMGLKQTLIEPDNRVSLDKQAPGGPFPNEYIRRLRVTGASWLDVTSLDLNDGLVTIIGTKGSGKTALAEMIAHAAGAHVGGPSSFLLKAQEHLVSAKATIEWGDGSQMDSHLDDLNENEEYAPAVRYLSQTFVDQLCSGDGLDSDLLSEIEKVVFQAIKEEERLGAIDFADLRARRVQHLRRLRATHSGSVDRLSTEIASEDEKKARLPSEQRKLTASENKLAQDTKELKALMPKGTRAEAEKLTSVQDTVDSKVQKLQQLKLQIQQLREMKADYEVLQHSSQEEFDNFRTRYNDCGLTAKELDDLMPAFSKRLPAIVKSAQAKLLARVSEIKDGSSSRPRDKKHLDSWPLKDLQTLQSQLEKAIGVEKRRAKK